MSTATILIVDDERLLRLTLRSRLEDKGFIVVEGETGEEAVRLVGEEDPDLVLLDYQLPDRNGLEVLDILLQRDRDLPVVMITGHGSVEGAVRAMRRGAIDYLEKPFEFDALLLTVESSLQTTALRREVRRLRREASEAGGASELVGRTPQMQDLNTAIDRVAQSDPATVLLQGESGTGKNVVARAIHQRSIRAEKPFVTITCTSLPENLLESELMGHERGAFTDAHSTKRGLLEVADGGTLFLDEIGELPLSLQAKLLHLLEDRSFRRIGGTRSLKVDVRIVAATNRDLRAAVERGQFRDDFYYRLNIVPIWIPALRERKADIPLLVDTFVTLFNRDFRKEVLGVTPAVLQVLMRYHWPGNVRELKNLVERVMILGGGRQVEIGDLPAELRGGPSLSPNASGGFTIPDGGLDLEELERGLLLQALERAGGNRTQAGRLLGLNRDQVSYRVEKFKIRFEDAGTPRLRVRRD
jgi:two-component system response regulator AtoC